MSDYISRQAAFEALEKRGVSTTNISRVPIADVRENVRGEWLPDLDYDGEDEWLIWECSNCGQLTESQTNFCPYCGAQMIRGDK